MGLDWNDLSLSGYLEAMEARAESMEPSKPEVSDWLRERVNGTVN